MKKVIILQHNKGRLANQLWLFVVVYAYCLERGYQCRNYSFFEYARFFSIPFYNFFVSIFFYFPYLFFDSVVPSLRRYYRFILRKLYLSFAFFVRSFFSGVFISSLHNSDEVFLFSLPPSNSDNAQVVGFESSSQNTLYIMGWSFINPVGIIKFRDSICSYFLLRDQYRTPLEDRIKELRRVYDYVIGVHIRKGDYDTFCYGSLLFSEAEAYSFMKEYLRMFSLDLEKTVFVIFSDGDIDISVFSGLRVVRERNKTDVEDLFELSMVDSILGSDSTFGAFASYYGNIPFIIFKREGIDWGYYQDKKEYFENKYSVVMPHQ